MRLLLVRHLMPDVAPGVCYGQSDVALKESLEAQSAYAAALKKQLMQLVAPETPVFSSPLQRCMTLASMLSPNVTEDARLRELNFGAWEMQTWDAIGVAALDAWAADPAGFRSPGGETGYELQQRALDWLRNMGARHGTVIAVTHGGIMRALQAHQQRLPGVDWPNLRYAYGELLDLKFTAEQIHAAPVQ